MLTALKAQQDPHCPWFLTGVTAPLVLQSTVLGRLKSSMFSGSSSSHGHPSHFSIPPKKLCHYTREMLT
ncbi:unnamed protein product, partial [Ixodes pacificus]